MKKKKAFKVKVKDECSLEQEEGVLKCRRCRKILPEHLFEEASGDVCKLCRGD